MCQPLTKYALLLMAFVASLTLSAQTVPDVDNVNADDEPPAINLEI